LHALTAAPFATASCTKAERCLTRPFPGHDAGASTAGATAWRCIAAAAAGLSARTDGYTVLEHIRHDGMAPHRS